MAIYDLIFLWAIKDSKCLHFHSGMQAVMGGICSALSPYRWIDIAYWCAMATFYLHGTLHFLKHFNISYCIKNPVLEPEWTLRFSLKVFLTEKAMGSENCVQIEAL